MLSRSRPHLLRHQQLQHRCPYLHNNICPVFLLPPAGFPRDVFPVASINKLSKNHTFFQHNAVVRAAANNFFHLTEKNTKRGSAITTEGKHDSYDNFSHTKLFADACLLADILQDAVPINNNKAKFSRTAYSNAPPPSPSHPECGACNVAIHVSPGYDFCVALLAVWISQCRAVPLNVNATDSEIDHILTESQTRIILTTRSEKNMKRKEFFDSHPQKFLQLPIDYSSSSEKSLTTAHRRAIQKAFQLDAVSPVRDFDDALLIATSGTTGKPKLAVSSHLAVSTGTLNLLNAWKWAPQDSLLHTLPLHHVHGLVNGVCCGIAASANIEFCSFDPAKVVDRLESGDVSLFFSVPAAYKKILSYLEKKHSKEQQQEEEFKSKMQKNLRLFVSGSSALPVPVLESFEKASGHKMLERYGMTELGMVLSQPYEPAEDRIPGTVGLPLPTVEVMLRKQQQDENEEGTIVSNIDENSNYDLLIRSQVMFSRYWGRPEKTFESFVFPGGSGGDALPWFDTGDCVKVIYSSDDNNKKERFVKAYAIQGRTSVDILKVSGYKISAVEIENAILDTGLVEECAVFALHKNNNKTNNNDTEDGTVVALISPASSTSSSDICDSDEVAVVISKLQQIMEEKFSHYKRPKKYFIAGPGGIERNAMGKINKKVLAKKYSE